MVTDLFGEGSLESRLYRLENDIHNHPRLEENEKKEILRRIEEIALIDSLTLLPNRGALSRCLDREGQRAIRHNHPLSVLIVDVDKFKNYNDTYGHEQGDIALKYVARTLASNRRPSDFVSRYGGEEFVIILPETELNGAAKAARDILNRFKKRKLTDYVGREDAKALHYVKGRGYSNLSVSVGISTSPELTKSVNLLLSDADSALYKAKDAGRNTLMIYSPPAILPNPLS
ncbi:MAG TPA: diguanylate cyclase [Candidatus Nanoarchaeia archaeon]|nr:diguanylate cyclase [Candidatus Nanoarchaeia archaeon]